MLSVLAFSDIILLCLMLLSTVDFKRINALAPIKHYYTLFFLTKTVETHDCEVHPSGVCVWMVCVCMDGVCVWMVCVYGWCVGGQWGSSFMATLLCLHLLFQVSHSFI